MEKSFRWKRARALGGTPHSMQKRHRAGAPIRVVGGFVLCALLLAAGCGGGGGGNGVLGGSNNGGSTGTVATGIRGRVVDSVSRQPIADAAVTVGNRSARTGADGKFALSTGVGTVSIQASAKDYNPSTFSSVVEQNQTTDVGDLPLASSEDNPPPPPI